MTFDNDNNFCFTEDQMDAEDGEQLRITFEDYRKISNVLILHMREFEEKNKGYHFTNLTPMYD